MGQCRVSEKYAAAPEVRKKATARLNQAAEERRDPVSFYDRQAALSSFEFARDIRKISRSQLISENPPPSKINHPATSWR